MRLFIAKVRIVSNQHIKKYRNYPAYLGKINITKIYVPQFVSFILNIKYLLVKEYKIGYGYILFC